MKANLKSALFCATALSAALSFAADVPAPATPPAETFASVMADAQKLRNAKKTDDAVAKAARALELADKPDDKAQGYWFIADNYWSDRKPDSRQEENLLKALAVEGITIGKRQFLVKDVVNKYYRNKGDEGFAKAKELIESTLAMPATSNAAIRIDLTSTLANLEFRNFKVDDAEKRLADLEKLPGLPSRTSATSTSPARISRSRKKTTPRRRSSTPASTPTRTPPAATASTPSTPPPGCSPKTASSTRSSPSRPSIWRRPPLSRAPRKRG